MICRRNSIRFGLSPWRLPPCDHHPRTRAVKIALLIAVLTVLAVIWMYPYFMLLITSLKSRTDLFKYSILSFPKRIDIGNYARAFKEAGLGLFIRNSMLISVIKVPVGILISSLAAFTIAKHRFRGRRFLYFFFVVDLAIPIQVTLLPLNILLKDLHLLNSIAALFFPYIAFGLPIQILVMRGYFQTVPNEIIDSGRIDGAKEWTIFSRLMLPLAVPALAALTILDFLATWNEFIMALIFIQNPEWDTLPLGLQAFQGQYSAQWSLLCQRVIVGVLPVVIVYLALQRYFTAGIYAGAIK